MKKQKIRCTIGVMDLFQRYSWPGNVREFKNVIERAVSLVDGDVIDVAHLPSDLVTFSCDIPKTEEVSSRLLSKELFRCEHHILVEALKLTEGNMSKTARFLGVSRSTFYEKCKKHNLLACNWSRDSE